MNVHKNMSIQPTNQTTNQQTTKPTNPKSQKPPTIQNVTKTIVKTDTSHLS